MTLDDDNHASSIHNRRTSSTRMDKEGDTTDSESEAMPAMSPSNLSSSHRAPVLDDLSESGNDSFGEASDGSVPDQEFLNQILEEYHPDRLNLLDFKVPTPPQRPPQRMTLKDVGKAKASSLSVEHYNLDSPRSDVEKPRGSPEDAHGTCSTVASTPPSTDRSEEIQVAEKEDDEEPTALPPNRPHLKSVMQNMGRSTKKSFRTINGSFFSRSFRGLTGRSKSKAKVDG